MNVQAPVIEAEKSKWAGAPIAIAMVLIPVALVALSACTVHRGDPAADDHMTQMSAADMASPNVMAGMSPGSSLARSAITTRFRDGGSGRRTA